MKYTANLFEAQPRIRDLLRNISPESVDSVVERISGSFNCDAFQSSAVRNLLESAKRDGWMVSESNDPFLAFEWILRTYANQIELNQLQYFKHWDYLTGTGLWSYFTEGSLPFDIPRSPNELPCIGFVSHQLMGEILERENLADPTIPPLCRQNRLELLEIMESLKNEKLDLYAVAFVAV